ncbi:MAG: LysR family transcriptional regulator [Coriobacteriales bacterium]|jgi:DNA-binding transcriptional LysR family regulator|nr:LysR family transcriptional regulator [Coriobacteriales bacterium]
MRTEQLQCFVEVVGQKSFTQAARRLYVSQPTVTQQIAALEAELGFKLLDRAPKRLALTPAGSYFYKAIQQELANLNGIVAKAKRISKCSEQCLTIGYTDIVTEPLFLPIIREFAINTPDASLQLHSAAPFELIKNLRDGNLALAFVAKGDFATKEEAFFVPLKTARLSLAVSKENPLSLRESLQWSELNSQQIILPEFNKHSQTYSSLFLTLAESCPAAEVLTQNDFRIALATVSFNFGVLLFPDLGQFKHEHIAFVPLEPFFEIELGLAALSAERTAIEDAFVDFVASKASSSAVEPFFEINGYHPS